MLNLFPFDDMGSSSLLKTEHEITIKIVSFVIFAPSSDIFILNVKPGSSISILFWLICFLRNDSSSVAKSSCAPGATPGVLVM